MAFAERQFPVVAQGEAFRHVKVAERFFASKIVAVLETGVGEVDREPRAGVGEQFGARECREYAEAIAETPSQFELK